MGANFSIGKFSLVQTENYGEHDCDEPDQPGCVCKNDWHMYDLEMVTLPESPAISSSYPQQNEVDPNFHTWYMTMGPHKFRPFEPYKTGLYQLIEKELCRHYAKPSPLRPKHLTKLRALKAKFQKRYPNVKSYEEAADDDELAYILRFFEWAEFWFDYAIKTYGDEAAALRL